MTGLLFGIREGVVRGPNQIVGLVFDISNIQSFYDAVSNISDHSREKCHITKSTEFFSADEEIFVEKCCERVLLNHLCV